MLQKIKPGLTRKAPQVLQISSAKVVHTCDCGIGSDQGLAKMRAQKSCGASH